MLVAIAVSTLLIACGNVSAPAPAPAALSVEDPASLLPANTLVYFGTSSVRAGSEAAKSSAMRAILDEPEVKAFMSKPVTAADRALAEMVKESGLAEAPRFTLSDMMAGKGDGTPIGRMFLALTHFSAPSAGGDGGMPDVGLITGLELLQAEDLGLVKALWGRIPATEETATSSGHEYLVKALPDGPRLCLAFVGNMAIASMSETSLKNVLAQAAEPTGASLAQSADYQDMLAAAGGSDHAGASTWLFRLEPVMGMLRTVLQLASADEDARQVVPHINEAIGKLGIDAITWLGGTGWRDATGRVQGVMTMRYKPDSPGMVARMINVQAPVDPAILKKVPGNCISFSAAPIDGWGEMYDVAMETFAAIAPDEYAEVQARLEEVMGESSLRDDILANMSGLLTTWTMPPDGFPPQPSQLLNIPVKDPEAFVKAAKSLVEGVNRLFLEGQGMPVSLVESDHEGHRLWELDVSRTPLAMAMMAPAFALDDHVVVASLQSSKAVKTALNGTLDAGSLADNSEFMAFVNEQAKHGALGSLSFSDNGKAFGALYGQLAPAAQMLGGSMGDLPVDFSLMPTEQAIRKHLGYSYMASYRAKPGTVVARSTSDFELGDFVPVVLTAGVLAATHAAGMESDSEGASHEMSPAERIQADLAQLNAGLVVYKISEGAYPASLEDLVKPLPDYEDGCLGRPDLPLARPLERGPRGHRPGRRGRRRHHELPSVRRRCAA